MRLTGFISIILILLTVRPALKAQPADPARADITGLWKGTLYNDSTQQYYRYEIAISEEKGKLIGYSHTWFLFEGQQYFGLKKIKLRRDGTKLITEDDGFVSHNYPVAPPKGVRQLNILDLQLSDSLMVLSGPFTTNQTRVYSSVTGNIRLERKHNYRQSSLVPHLQELGLEKKLSFVQPIPPDASADVAVAVIRELDQPVQAEATLNPNRGGAETLSPNETSRKGVDEKISAVNPVPVPALPVQTEKETSLSTDNRVKEAVAMTPETQAEKNIGLKPVSKGVPAISGPSAMKPAAELYKRKNVIQQVVMVKTDSLLLTLYDNGEVDGDTVSVLMNGEVLIDRQLLTTKAMRKTVYLPAGADSVQLIMYAESLGSIPPNTGLLVIRDGQDVYEVRFSGDLERNAAILLKRRR